MSRTTYGVIAFKIPHPEGASQADMILTARRAIKEATDLMAKYGAEPSTIEEVQYMAGHNPENLGSMGVTDSGGFGFEGPLDGKRGEK